MDSDEKRALEERRKAIEGAKVLERHGRHDSAVQLLSKAGAFDEAARVLSGQRRFKDAAELLMKSLEVPPDQVGTLNPEGKKLALMAAVCYSRAGNTSEAVELFVALKEHQRAAQLLEKAGDTVGAARVLASAGRKLGSSAAAARGVGGAAITLEGAQKLEAQGKHQLAIQAYVWLNRYGEAGRVAQQIGKIADAASFYAEAGMVYEAGNCYFQAGDSGKAIENLIRVPRDHRHYRAACIEVARMAAELSYVGLKMDHFLARFIEEGPQDAREQESFYLLSKVYQQHDLMENAKEVLKKLLARSPYRDAAAKLAALEKGTGAHSAQYERILKDEVAHQEVGLPSRTGPARVPVLDAPFPDLPPLPETAKPAAAPIPLVSQVASAPVAAAGPRPTAQRNATEQMLGRDVGEDVERIAREVSSDGAGGSASVGRTLFAVGTPAASRPTSAEGNRVAPAAVPFELSGSLRLQRGSILAERYRLEEKIGQGGMAMVFRATDLELSEEIALKVFNPANEDEQALSRFRQEVQLSRKLVHPNVVRLFDMGIFNGRRFITMELLVGSDLKHQLIGPMLVERGLGYLIQACAGLQAAHERGIIHRDIKPENLFITGEGVVKVMDFGIAKRQLAKGVTVAGMVAGTPEYIAPEQIDNFTSVTPATDQYSLGVVAYEMFTGRLPFHSPELVPMLMMHINQAPPPPRSINPALPEALDQLLLKLLEKKPERRFPDCNALAQALEEIRQAASAT